jgi:hypothetical protein
LTFDLICLGHMLPLLMLARVFKSRLSGSLGLLLIMALVARAETSPVQTSPFLPADASSSPAVSAEGPIEFHGYLATPGGERFSIYNTARKTATWVGLNEKGGQFVVRSHRVVGGNTDQITVEYQGSTLTLALKSPKIAAAPIPAAPIFGQPLGMIPTGNAPVVQGNAPNLPAGASLDEWAAEVQRRRALRQQSAPPGSPAPPAPGQQPVQGGPDAGAAQK